jgi:hypothetical protein
MDSKLLDRQRIRGLVDAAIDAGIEGQRIALVAGIDAKFLALLPVSPSPLAQMQMDLHALNVVLADGSVPLLRWVQNAHLLAGPRAAATVFEAALVDLDHPPARPPQLVEGRECPFPGLAFFDESMARFFFGRSAEINEAVAQLGDTPYGHRRWLQIEGPSGAGKSSLARAGIVPAIREGQIAGAPKRWRVAIFRPGTNPVRALAREVVKALEGLEAPPLDEMLKQLHSGPGALGEILHKHVPAGEGFLLVVDQLEEALTVADRRSGDELDALLADALVDDHGSLHLVTTIRSDFVGRLSELPALASLLEDHERAARYSLKAMSDTGLLDLVEKPAKLCGVEWEKGFAELVRTEALASTCALPLLAHVLRALWLRDSGHELTCSAYRALGGVGGALAKSADAIVNALGEPGKEQARKLLLRLVRIGRGADDTRQTASQDEVLAAAGGEDPELVLTRLSGGRDPMGAGGALARLVMVGEQEAAGERRIELIHEALLGEWGTLRRWLDEARKSLERRDDVEAAELGWAAAGEPEGGLPRGGQLAYLRGAEGVSRRGKRYLEAAEKLERAKLARHEAAKANEARAEKKRSNQARAMLIAVIVATASFLVILIPNVLSSAREQEATKRKLLGQTNRTNAMMAAGSVLSYLRSLGDAVRSCSEDESLARALEEGRTDELDAILKWWNEFYDDPSRGLKTDDESPFFLWFILDKNGIAKAYSTRRSDPRFVSMIGRSYVWRDYFNGAQALAGKKQHQTYVSSAFRSTTDDFHQFAISAPIYGGDNEWKGVLVAAVTTKSKLGSLDTNDGQNVAVLVAPEDPTGLTPWIRPTSPPDPPRYAVLSHRLIKDGEYRMLDNDLVRNLGRNSQENEKHIEQWWELPGSRWVRSSDDYEDPLGKRHLDADTGVEIAADPAYSGRRQASFAPVGHTGFVVIVRASEADTLRGEKELVWRLIRWAAIAAVPGVLFGLAALFYSRRK